MAWKISRPARRPYGFLTELDIALGTGDDDAVTRLLAIREAYVDALEGFQWCKTHERRFHKDDGCPECGTP